MIKNDFKTIDEYITVQPKEIAILLENVRATIKKAAPEATEAISYAIPTFKFHGNLVHFANFKNPYKFIFIEIFYFYTYYDKKKPIFALIWHLYKK